MEYIALGKTNLLVSKTAFGAMSLDCKEIESLGEKAEETVAAMVRQAYDGGINFFDVSRSKPLCEKRLGAALHDIRKNVVLATKSQAQTASDLRNDIQESLNALNTDVIDLYQFDSLSIVPLKDGPDGLYNEMLRLKDKGSIRHIGYSTDSYELATQAIESGLYDVVQFPFNMLTDKACHELVESCEKTETGCLASQPLCGGLVSNIPLAYGFFTQFETVVPLWGVHTQDELHQILYFTDHPPKVDEQFKKEVAEERYRFS
ncbi:MAG: aldo/keto reductase [Treponema sp.]|nr:aldo/keto reductase [Treponema sp.]